MFMELRWTVLFNFHRMNNFDLTSEFITGVIALSWWQVCFVAKPRSGTDAVQIQIGTNGGDVRAADWSRMQCKSVVTKLLTFLCWLVLFSYSHHLELWWLQKLFKLLSHCRSECWNWIHLCGCSRYILNVTFVRLWLELSTALMQPAWADDMMSHSDCWVHRSIYGCYM